MCSHNRVIITYNSLFWLILLSHLGFFCILKFDLSPSLTLASYYKSAVYNTYMYVYIFTCLRLQTPLKRTAQCVVWWSVSQRTVHNLPVQQLLFLLRIACRKANLKGFWPHCVVSLSVAAGSGFVRGRIFSEKHSIYEKGFIFHDWLTN